MAVRPAPLAASSSSQLPSEFGAGVRRLGAGPRIGRRLTAATRRRRRQPRRLLALAVSAWCFSQARRSQTILGVVDAIAAGPARPCAELASIRAGFGPPPRSTASPEICALIEISARFAAAGVVTEIPAANEEQPRPMASISITCSLVQNSGLIERMRAIQRSSLSRESDPFGRGKAGKADGGQPPSPARGQDLDVRAGRAPANRMFSVHGRSAAAAHERGRRRRSSRAPLPARRKRRGQSRERVDRARDPLRESRLVLGPVADELVVQVDEVANQVMRQFPLQQQLNQREALEERIAN